MDTLTDTNILLRLLDERHPHHSIAVEAVGRISDAGDTLLVTTQNLIELWAVMTRPAASNGFAFTTSEANTALRLIERDYVRLPDRNDNLFQEWRSLVTRFGVSGKQVHDARLVAAMRVHGVRRILTFNTADFARYSERITAVHPAEAAAASS